jgi:hypothetical protein
VTKPQKYAAGGVIVGLLIGVFTGVGGAIKRRV